MALSRLSSWLGSTPIGFRWMCRHFESNLWHLVHLIGCAILGQCSQPSSVPFILICPRYFRLIWRYYMGRFVSVPVSFVRFMSSRGCSARDGENQENEPRQSNLYSFHEHWASSIMAFKWTKTINMTNNCTQHLAFLTRGSTSQPLFKTYFGQLVQKTGLSLLKIYAILRSNPRTVPDISSDIEN